MIGKGKSISHGVAALEYDLAKEIDGQAAATEIETHVRKRRFPPLSKDNTDHAGKTPPQK